MSIRAGLIGAFLAVVVGNAPATAQTFTGGIRGVVTDANGVLPGAR